MTYSKFHSVCKDKDVNWHLRFHRLSEEMLLTVLLYSTEIKSIQFR